MLIDGLVCPTYTKSIYFQFYLIMREIHQQLKTRQREERERYPTHLGLRVHRALSWLQRAANEEDVDSQFIFLWIAFNAAYATDIDERKGLVEQETFNAFIGKLHELDTQQRFNHLVWNAYPNAIRVLLDNRYVFAPFWAYQKGLKSKEEWEDEFVRAKRAAHAAFAKQDTPVVLSIVLSRIYVLRNQMVHGGATWNSSINRNQVRDCLAIMRELVPLLIEIMMDNPNTLWGEANFPPVKD